MTRNSKYRPLRTKDTLILWSDNDGAVSDSFRKLNNDPEGYAMSINGTRYSRNEVAAIAAFTKGLTRKHRKRASKKSK